ncbi:MAG: hypothetical protein IKT93_03570 [Clostridia bacterium]|nr:hypothetical protein [Clostridia bacterium]
MKKIICLIFLVLLSFSGCAKKSPEVTPVTTGLKFNAQITNGEQNLNCSVKIDANGNMQMKIDQIEYLFSGNTITINYADISHKTELSAFPKNTFADFLYVIFNSVSKSGKDVITNDKEYYISNSTDKYEYTCFFAQTGLPLKITEKNFGITALITGAQII